MKIASISVRNFRLLKNFTVLLDDELSVVIGKNNTGKTSLLAAMSKFLDPKEYGELAYDDINTSARADLCRLLTKKKDEGVDKIPFSIGLTLEIVYNDDEDLSPVAELITNLDPNDSTIILEFAYELTGGQLTKMRERWKEAKQAKKPRIKPEEFLQQNLLDFLGPLKRRSKSTIADGHDIDLNKPGKATLLKDVIAFECVSARRDVTNKESDKTLSGQTAKIYKALVSDNSSEPAVEDFKSKLRSADSSFSKAYENLFADLVSTVRQFGGVREGDSNITIMSTLQHRDILTGNATVMYKDCEHTLPEHYNGLGYMNLISMIFEIDLLLKKFRNRRMGAGASINLLFIEEPEAHTHPQMQYVFIKNIRKLLDTATKPSESQQDTTETSDPQMAPHKPLSSLQTVISTHSAHIVAEAEFDLIKYLRRCGQEVESKNLRELENEFSNAEEDKRRFRFLKQYLTLHRAELFFADKVILVEGDTERILLPAMMRKLDQAGVPKKVAPILSQNVSIVEVGAHSKVYEKFIHFLGLKTLVITDIDSGYNEKKGEENVSTSCSPTNSRAEFTSNTSLCFFHGKERNELKYFLQLTREGKTCGKREYCKKDADHETAWQSDSNGIVFTAYQTTDGDYCGRSFEDAFFALNKNLLDLGADQFPSLTKKWYHKYMKEEIGPLEFVEKAVNSKPSLAIEVLLNSEMKDGKAYTNWKTPGYIEEGLKWLRGDFDA